MVITDSYGDGGQGVSASYTYLSGSQEAQVTPAGTELDNDDDQDGVNDVIDAYPYDDCGWIDTDSDGIPDTVCTADDFAASNLGFTDSGTGIQAIDKVSMTVILAEAFTTDSTQVNGSYTNCASTLTLDGWDVSTGSWSQIGFLDLCATTTSYSIGDALGTSQSFSDMGAYKFTLVADGIGTSVMHYVTADPDDDNDGTPDVSDAFTTDASEDTDTDGDGVGNNADTDDDTCPAAANATLGITCNSGYYPGDGVVDANEASGCTMIIDCDGDSYIDLSLIHI